ncbi:MAG: DUF3598 family protein [Moorea sp. SIO2B7]|nr:DUF3598 family protein [Moorena sp. SIO2B7]
MDLQEQHWTKLFGKITTEGNYKKGIWTIYSAKKEVINSYEGWRIFSANEEKTIITHLNKFPSPDGTTRENNWIIEKEKCNQPDGLSHPASLQNRGLALSETGITAWISKKFELGRNFGVELFLRNQDSNDSIGSIYGETGKLEKILHIREHLGSLPNQPVGKEIKHISGNWKGKKQSMTPDLKISAPVDTQELVLEPTDGKNETFFLPDGIVVNIPTTLNLGEKFEIVAGKLMGNEYKRLTAKYDDSGAFILLISELFHLQ